MSVTNKIQIKITSIKDVPMNTYVDEFTFIVNGQEFPTSRLFSDLISSKICRIHQVDPTYNQMIINTKSSGNFSKFIEDCKFDERQIEEQSILFYNEIIEHLGEEHFNITTLNTTKETTYDEKENIFERISRHRAEGIFSHDKYETEVNEISQHFYEYVEHYATKMKELGYEILNDIISNSKLRLKSEDQLLTFINSIYIEKNEFCHLYDHIILKNVSSNSMNEFLNIFDYNDINGNLWSSISTRLSEEIKTNKENYEKEDRYKTSEYKITNNEDETKKKEILYKEGNEFNGIIQYLTSKTGSNIHDNKTIEVSTNSPYLNYHPKNLLDFNQDNYYASKPGDQTAWICFDFKNMKIELSHYSIKSHNNSSANHHIKNWVIEISDDGKEWTKIDEHSNYTELNGRSIIKTFKISQKHFSRFIRLRNNGEFYGCNSGYCLCLNSIEFYGQLQET